MTPMEIIEDLERDWEIMDGKMISRRQWVEVRDRFWHKLKSYILAGDRGAAPQPSPEAIEAAYLGETPQPTLPEGLHAALIALSRVLGNPALMAEDSLEAELVRFATKRLGSPPEIPDRDIDDEIADSMAAGFRRSPQPEQQPAEGLKAVDLTVEGEGPWQVGPNHATGREGTFTVTNRPGKPINWLRAVVRPFPTSYPDESMDEPTAIAICAALNAVGRSPASPAAPPEGTP